MSSITPLHLVRSKEKQAIAFANGKLIFVWIDGDQPIKTLQHEDIVRSFSFHENLPLFVSAGDDKQVKLWNTSDWSCSGTLKIGKKILQVAFSRPDTQNPSGTIVFSDKFGDCYWSVLPTLGEPVILLGHFSTVTQMIFSLDHSLLITADRDEKIRVSHFPLAYDIEQYCLGHRTFVSRLCIPPQYPNLLISGGGDGSIKLWDFRSGKELFSFNTHSQPNPGQNINIITLACSSKNNTVVAILEGVCKVLLFTVSDHDLTLQQEFAFPDSKLFDACFDVSGNLWIVGYNPILMYLEFDGTQFVQKKNSLEDALNQAVQKDEEKAVGDILGKLSLEQFRKPEFENPRRKKE
eukprot:TRINITY_DN8401_c0_g1_i1.p1 TRINITY_DN8401_c0_g1~~TRINITY_DN8401_c0_g1_i1.p1  ORF type:complete len:350 (+),score=68.18 TRINITY_DN8401_c0_g1_i1:41-1090(+)